jgi:hypothetical protein
MIDEVVLFELHQSLFDCDAAVRLAAVQTLGMLGRKVSLPVLGELQSIEKESNWVKMAIEEANQAIAGTLNLRAAKFVKDPSVI